MSKLFVVGTPIGNLKDMTPRAVETLEMVDMIACEDTRHSLPLLKHFAISKPLFACHQHNEQSSAEKICEMLQEGKNIALISDAGMPSVSDPGAVVVAMCHEKGLEVEVVPGPTAVTSAVALAGLTGSGFAFIGFLPAKKGEKVKKLQKYQNLDLPMVFYCAPHDILDDAKVMFEVYGNRKVWVVKELTKMFENLFVTSLENFEIPEPRGEYVVIVDGKNEEENNLLELTIEEHLQFYIDLGDDNKTAIKKVAVERGLNKNEVYQVAIMLKNKE